MKTNHKTAAKCWWQSAILLAITALALCASPAFAATTYWTDTTGSWFDCTHNWSSGCPSCTINAQINNGGTAQVSSPNATASADDLTLGYGTADSGNVSVPGVSGGSLSICGSAFVAYQGTGSMSVTNGGTVGGSVATSGNLSIASLSGQLWTSNGSATVDGTNSTWTVSSEVDVGGTTSSAGGTGLLKVTNGGTVSAGTSVHVWNSGTLAGNGTVNVNSGSGTATFDGTLAPKGGGTTLTFDGNLQLNSTATTQCNVTPQDPSTTPQVSVSAQVSLGGHLSVTMTGDFRSAPTRFTLLYATSVASMHLKFDSKSLTYPTDQCWYPVITYYSDPSGHYYVYLDRLDNCN